MKTNLSRTLMLTAVVVMLGAAAYGQDNLTAKVPFAFQIRGTELAAGNYSVSPMAQKNGFPVMHVRNRATGQSNLILAQNRAADVKGGSPRLIFRCGDLSGCSLATIWTAGGYGWELPVPRLSADERERFAVVFLHRSEAE